jgi:hypothetical protein
LTSSSTSHTLTVSRGHDSVQAQLDIQAELLREEAEEEMRQQQQRGRSDPPASLIPNPDALYRRAAVAAAHSPLSTSFEPPAHTSSADSNSRLIVRIPKLFDWYRNDFGKSSENILQWIAQHHPVSTVLGLIFPWAFTCHSF